MKHKPVVFLTGTHSDTIDSDLPLDLWWTPVIKTRELSLDHELFNQSYDWIIFTSRNAVEYMAGYLEKLDVSNVASIGSKTSETLKQFDFTPDFESDVFSQEGFIDKFPVHRGLNILYPASKKRRPKLEDYLKEAQCNVKAIDLYEPVENEAAIEYLFENLHKADALVFSSPSGVRAVFDSPLMNDGYLELLRQTRIVSIGPVTADVVVKYGFDTSHPNTYTNKETIKLLCKLLEVS